MMGWIIAIALLVIANNLCWAVRCKDRENAMYQLGWQWGFRRGREAAEMEYLSRERTKNSAA